MAMASPSISMEHGGTTGDSPISPGQVLATGDEDTDDRPGTTGGTTKTEIPTELERLSVEPPEEADSDDDYDDDRDRDDSDDKETGAHPERSKLPLPHFSRHLTKQRMKQLGKLEAWRMNSGHRVSGELDAAGLRPSTRYRQGAEYAALAGEDGIQSAMMGQLHAACARGRLHEKQDEMKLLDAFDMHFVMQNTNGALRSAYLRGLAEVKEAKTTYGKGLSQAGSRRLNQIMNDGSGGLSMQRDQTRVKFLHRDR
eukprot:scpid24942/ scgid9655/ 